MAIDPTQAANDVNAIFANYSFGPGETDIANAIAKNEPGNIEGPNDYANYLQALTAQAELRNQPHDQGGSSDGLNQGNYGSGYGMGSQQYSTLQRPDYLRGPFSFEHWDQTFRAPTIEEAQADPGYALGMEEGQRGIQRAAASRGSVLNPGTVKALERFGTDYGATRYSDVYGRALQAYQQNYGQFMDKQNLLGQARNINENAYEFDVGANYNQYLARYNAYRDAVRDNMDFVGNIGLGAATAGRPAL